MSEREIQVRGLVSRLTETGDKDPFQKCLEVFRVFGDGILLDPQLCDLLLTSLDPYQLGAHTAVAVLVATNIQDKEILLPARAAFREKTRLLLVAEGERSDTLGQL